MRLSSLRYLISEGFRSLWQNRFMALASVAVLFSCLILSGASYMLYVNIEEAFDWIYEQNVVVVFASEENTDEQTIALGDALKNLSNVSDVTFLSKEETLEKYQNAIPEATYESLQGENNPMLDSYLVSFEDMAQFNDTVSRIQQLSGVDDISYNGDIAKTLTNLRSVVLTIGGWVILLLLLISLFIISNTIKLTVYNRRLEIHIMKSVGATNMFIRIPFVVEGITIGVLSGLVSYGVLYYVYEYLQSLFGNELFFSLVNFSDVWQTVLLGFLGIGAVTGLLGSVISMSRYLRIDTMDELV